MRARPLPGLALSIVLILLSSCVARTGPAPQTAGSRADRLAAEGDRALGRGFFERALERYAEAWKEKPGHPDVVKGYPEALAGLKKEGDDAFLDGRYEEAGIQWAATVRSLGHPAARGQGLPFTKATIRGSIQRLSETLMEKALIHYTRGNVEEAVEVWRTILSFDPSHQEAARSLQTATTQLENLRKIPGGKPPAP